MKIDIQNTLRVTEEIEFIRDVVVPELTLDNPIYLEALKSGRYLKNINPVIKNFKVDSSGTIHLPRGYKDRLIHLLTNENIPVEIIDNRIISPVDFVYEHNIDLRDYQFTALQNLVRHSEGCIVSPAASGKTVMGISLIIMSNQKTLWITHTKPLALQFVERIPQFITNIHPSDVKRLGTGAWSIGDKIFVGLVQSLNKDVNKLMHIYNDIGLVIVDEAHHTPATTFTKVINKFNPFYLFGLTATPLRRDGLQNMLYQSIGPIRHTVSREEIVSSGKIITPTVKVVKLNTHVEGDTFAEIISSLVYNDSRTNHIVSDVIREANNGHICIVTTDRKIHAEIILEKLQKAKLKVGIATADYSDKLREDTIQRLEKGEITVLVCTTALLGEGFDHAPLDRLFIGAPFRNIVKCEQLVGRVQRKSPRKNDAVIFDYVDINNSLLVHQFKNSGTKGCRINVYKKLGCTVEE